MNLKKNKGYTGIDLVIAIMIIFLAISISSVLFIKITNKIRTISYNSMATTYMVQMLEEIDISNYSSVNSTMGAFLKGKYNIPSEYDVVIQVEERYADYIKIVSLTISYTVNDEQEEITIRKLKVAEI